MSVFTNIYDSKVQAKYKEVFTQTNASDSLMYYLFYNAIVNSFSWEKMPLNIPEFLPEESLYWWGQMAGFEDNGEFKIFPCYAGGEYLENGLYSSYIIVAKNGKTWIKRPEEIELCFNNRDRFPTAGTVFEFSEKASYALRAVDIALERAVIPKIIECKDTAQGNAIADMYDKSKSLIPFRITTAEGFGNGDIKTHNLFDNRDNDIIALWDIFTRYKNLFYTTYGFQNTEIQKAERLTEQESRANIEAVRYTLFSDMLHQRLDFIDRVKNKFGVDIELRINRDTSTVWEMTTDNKRKIEIYEQGNISTTNDGIDIKKEDDIYDEIQSD